MIKSYDVKMIPIDKIRVINPRSRNKTKFKEIVGNISEIGLKKPITVSILIEEPESDEYDLVCGQGRLEAFVKLGQTHIPAIVIEISREERLIMSLVENLARRNPQTMEMVRQIGSLRDRGYNNVQIGKKIGVSDSWVHGVLKLLDNGEERLIQAVEKKIIPLSIAVMIASAEEAELQTALIDAYEKNELKGAALLRARKIIEKRKTYGKSRRGPQKKMSNTMTSDAVVRAYKDEAKRQRLTIKKAKMCETQLLFMVNAFRQLFKDEKFISILKAEELDTLPTYMAEYIWR